MRKWSHPAQRNRQGQALPPALTVDGSAQIPNETATSPTNVVAAGDVELAVVHQLAQRLPQSVTGVKRQVPIMGRHDRLPHAGPAAVIFIAGGTARLPLLTAVTS